MKPDLFTLRIVAFLVNLIFLYPELAVALRPMNAGMEESDLSKELKERLAARVRLEEPLRVHIRWMIRRDMPEVLAIEDSIERPLGGAGWSEEDFLPTLHRRNAIGFVVEHEDKMVGFMIYELHKNRLSLLKLAVDLDYRRLDVGTAMVDKLKSKLSSHRRTRIVVDVRESDRDAQEFFKKMEFRAKVMPGRFNDTGEGIYRMTFQLPGSEPLPEEVAPPVKKGESSAVSAATITPTVEPYSSGQGEVPVFPSGEEAEEGEIQPIEPSVETVEEPLGAGYSLVGDDLEEQVEPSLRPGFRQMTEQDLPEAAGMVDLLELPLGGKRWTEGDFRAHLGQPDTEGIVARDGKNVVGFSLYELKKDKVALLSFAVHPDHRGRGVGKAMVDELKNELHPGSRSLITVLVRESDVTTQRFFYELDFRAKRTLRNYFQDTREAAIWMEYLLPAVDSKKEAAGFDPVQAARQEALEAWREVSATPARPLIKRLLPIFYASETFQAIPLAAKGGLPFLVIVSSQAEEEAVETLLKILGIQRASDTEEGQYLIWRSDRMGLDPLAALAKAKERFSQYDSYPVDPSRPIWLQELLTRLEKEGVIPLGLTTPALQATERYFKTLA